MKESKDDYCYDIQYHTGLKLFLERSGCHIQAEQYYWPNIQSHTEYHIESVDLFQ